MKHNLIFLKILGIFLFSCGNEELPERDDTHAEFVSGDVIIGINADVPIYQVFDLINEHNMVIDKMSGFFNYSTLPNDSITYVVNYLKNKSYLNKRGFTGGSAFVSKTYNRITVTELLFEMDKLAQKDWLETLSKLELRNLGNDTKYLVIKVERGTEEHWANRFLIYSEVKWTDLNWYAEIELY